MNAGYVSPALSFSLRTNGLRCLRPQSRESARLVYYIGLNTEALNSGWNKSSSTTLQDDLVNRAVL